MHIFVDTEPRWSGGYIAHLKGLLSSSIPNDIRLTVYGTKRLFEAISPINKRVNFVVDDTLPLNPFSLKLWRITKLPKIIDLYSPDVHFSPGGYLDSRLRKDIPQITMLRNLQPFLKSERKRISFYKYDRLRLEILRRSLLASYKKAKGVIFLSEFAREIVISEGLNIRQSTVIPHGLSDIFRRFPNKKQLLNKPVILYVSGFLIYKHQWHVAEAVAQLRKETGIDLQLRLVGDVSEIKSTPFASLLKKLRYPKWIHIESKVPYSRISEVYHSADLFIFASTVEAISNIFLEAMASGLPIAYSNRRPMTDILGDDGMIFEPEDPLSIATAIRKLLENCDLRYRCALNAYNRALSYSWERTARETFNFIIEVESKYGIKAPRLTPRVSAL